VLTYNVTSMCLLITLQACAPSVEYDFCINIVNCIFDKRETFKVS